MPEMPAARITDMHFCPMFTVLVPHVGGPIQPPCSTNVTAGDLASARVSDLAICATGPPDILMMGSVSVTINDFPAVRMTDQTAHGGLVAVGLPTVLIGGPVMVGNPAKAAKFFPGQQQNKDTCAVMSTQGVVNQATGASIPEPAMQVIGVASGAYTICSGTGDMSQLMAGAGIPATNTANPTIQQIVDALGQGKAVLVGLDARPIWGSTAPQPLGHGIRVTGAEKDEAGNVTAIYINDTGTGKAGQRVPIASFQSALTGFGGGRMTASDNPVP